MNFYLDATNHSLVTMHADCLGEVGCFASDLTVY
jgi:hypothetical protein